MKSLSRIINDVFQSRTGISHPANQEVFDAAVEALVGCKGQFTVCSGRMEIDTDGIDTREQARNAIFDLAARSFDRDKKSAGMLSPLGVAMHIRHALAMPTSMRAM